MKSVKDLALEHTYTCFFNSLLREIDFYSVDNDSAKIILPIGALTLPLKRHSLVGRHEYSGQFYWGQGNSTQLIDFKQTLELLVPQLFKKSSTDQPQLEKIFIDRILNSALNMELSLEARKKHIESLFSDKISFEQAEQSLFIGHNFHPYPKMREGFNDADFKIYSPEMAGQFNLHWVAFEPIKLKRYKANKFSDFNWTDTLAQFDQVHVPSELEPIPMHPWQLEVLLKSGRIHPSQYTDLGKGKNFWYPTSSLRTVYCPGAPYMLKFSLTLKLTNSIRHLTGVEVVRGMQVYDVLQSTKGLEFLKKYPKFKIITEPAFVGIKDENEDLMTDTLVVARSNPFPSDSKNSIVVSTLAQDHPFKGANLISFYIQRLSQHRSISLRKASLEWFQKYLDVALIPLVYAQANYGILLGAHQQNLILQIEDNLPSASYFRDCQGTGYSQIGYDFYHKEVPTITKENGNVLGDMGNILFAYYLIINSTFNILAAIAQNSAVTEQELMEELKDNLLRIRQQNPLDTSFLDYVLDQKEILQKGNFYCSLENINENTTENPLALYNLIPNPLYLGGRDASI